MFESCYSRPPEGRKVGWVVSILVHCGVAGALLSLGTGRARFDLIFVPVVHAAGPEMMVMELAPSHFESATRPSATGTSVPTRTHSSNMVVSPPSAPARPQPVASKIEPDITRVPITAEMIRPAIIPIPVALRMLPNVDLYPAEAPPPAETVSDAEPPIGRELPADENGGGVQIHFAELLLRTTPDYPLEARTKGVQGTVLLSGTVSIAGNVTDLRVVSGNPLLKDAAMECVRHWRYRPASIGGIAVISPIRVYVNFVLKAVQTASQNRPDR